ncbi:EamA-like transporter family protein [Martelella alba]|uniref:EamA-like transporter family protein n=1 Tax=Martelella alba TaxID=2590451 RepID=A0A506UDT3_9HYPH|nr:DMT family transporter [Martelella alba]TPW32602.1 EamA-like transporter family protein [Martelella alba]
MTTQSRPAFIYFIAAFASGGLLAAMTHMNGLVAHYGNPLFASFVAHGAGTIAAIIFLGLIFAFSGKRRPAGTAPRLKAPWWAYLGGISGAATVILASLSVNSPLALSGTIALGLAGQVIFSLAADRWGLFGLPARKLDLRDFLTVALILGGSVAVILAGGPA